MLDYTFIIRSTLMFRNAGTFNCELYLKESWRMDEIFFHSYR